MSESDALGSNAPTDSASFQEQAAHYEALVETMRERADEGFVVGGLFLKRSAVGGGVGAKGVGLGHLSCDVGRGM